MSKSALAIGIVGLPNVGKSTLFNALLKRQAALAANYPFATIEPNVGVVDVPDQRLNRLAEIVRSDYGARIGDRVIPEKLIPAVIKFYDIAGLVKGASQGEGLGNEFLGHIREVDAIIHLVRDFSDENVIRAGSTDPQSDLEIINTELALADIQLLDKRIERLDKEMRSDKTGEASLKVGLYKKLRDTLGTGTSISKDALTDKEKELLKDVNLLTLKPFIYVFNTDESTLSKKLDQNNIISRYNGLLISAKIESEICSLPTDEERSEFMEALGLNESGLDKIIKRGYAVLGLHSYLTMGPKEVRAWTIKKGARAPEAAGVIHTDFERGFISAEVVSFSDLDRHGSLKLAKEKGFVRLEGKTYIMRDGDVVEFNFSV